MWDLGAQIFLFVIQTILAEDKVTLNRSHEQPKYKICSSILVIKIKVASWSNKLIKFQDFSATNT